MQTVWFNGLFNLYLIFRQFLHPKNSRSMFSIVYIAYIDRFVIVVIVVVLGLEALAVVLIATGLVLFAAKDYCLLIS